MRILLNGFFLRHRSDGYNYWSPKHPILSAEKLAHRESRATAFLSFSDTARYRSCSLILHCLLESEERRFSEVASGRGVVVPNILMNDDGQHDINDLVPSWVPEND